MMEQRLQPYRKETKVAEIDIAGAGRGMNALLPYIGEFNAESTALEVRPRVVAPRPDQLASARANGRVHGVEVTPLEARVEDVVAREGEDRASPLVLTLDNPLAVAKALHVAAAANRPTLLYIFIKMMTGQLLAVAAVLTRNDRRLKEQLARLFAAMTGYTVRSGSAAVFGDDARAATLENEEFFRGWIGRHARENLLKVFYDLEPNVAPIQVSLDGDRSMTLLIEESPDRFKDFDALASSVTNNLIVPIEPGKDVMIAEIGPSGIRFHTARLRKLDGKFVINGAETHLAHPSLKADVALVAGVAANVAVGLIEALGSALQSAERHTVTSISPVYTSD